MPKFLMTISIGINGYYLFFFLPCTIRSLKSGRNIPESHLSFTIIKRGQVSWLFKIIRQSLLSESQHTGKNIPNFKRHGGKLLQSWPTLCNSMDCSPPGYSVQWYYPGKNTGGGCHALFQGTSAQKKEGREAGRKKKYFSFGKHPFPVKPDQLATTGRLT